MIPTEYYLEEMERVLVGRDQARAERDAARACVAAAREFVAAVDRAREIGVPPELGPVLIPFQKLRAVLDSAPAARPADNPTTEET